MIDTRGEFIGMIDRSRDDFLDFVYELPSANNVDELPEMASGVYFISDSKFSNGNIVYIGSSVDILRRLRGHSNWDKESRVYFLPCHNIREVEGIFISIIRPIGNKIVKNEVTNYDTFVDMFDLMDYTTLRDKRIERFKFLYG
jgi:hypothetical protein